MSQDKRREIVMKRMFSDLQVILYNKSQMTEGSIKDRKESAQSYEVNFQNFLQKYGQILTNDEGVVQELLAMQQSAQGNMQASTKAYYSREVAENILVHVKEEYPHWHEFAKSWDEAAARKEAETNKPQAVKSWVKASGKSLGKENISRAMIKDFEVLLRVQAKASKEGATDLDKDIYARHLAAFGRQHSEYLNSKGFADLREKLIDAIPKDTSTKQVDYKARMLIGLSITKAIDTVQTDYASKEFENVVHLENIASRNGSTAQEKSAYAAALQNFSSSCGDYIKKNGFEDLAKNFTTKMMGRVPENVNPKDVKVLEGRITKGIEAVKKDYGAMKVSEVLTAQKK